jgi:hypothetical protein
MDRRFKPPELSQVASAPGQVEDSSQIPTSRMLAMHRRQLARKANAEANPKTRVPEGAGRPLAPEVRARMEPQLGGDLSAVRIHDSSESAAAARGFGARAFTVGTDVHFARGEFAPGTRTGDQLLAHELTHVVQDQNAGIQRKAASECNDLQVSQPHEPHEHEADSVAETVAERLHGSPSIGAAAARTRASSSETKIHRSPDPHVTAEHEKPEHEKSEPGHENHTQSEEKNPEPHSEQAGKEDSPKAQLIAMLKGKVAELKLGKANVEVGGTAFAIAGQLGLNSLIGPAAIVVGPAAELIEYWNASDREAEIQHAESILESAEIVEDPQLIEWLIGRFHAWEGDLQLLEHAVADAASKNPSEAAEEAGSSHGGKAKKTEMQTEMLKMLQDLHPEWYADHEGEIIEKVFKMSPGQLAYLKEKILSGASAVAIDVGEFGNMGNRNSAGHEKPGKQQEKGLQRVKKPAEILGWITEALHSTYEANELAEEGKEAGGKGAEHAGKAGGGGVGTVLEQAGNLARALKLLAIKQELIQIRADIAAGKDAEKKTKPAAHK